jgi:plastocyanin
MAVPGQAQGAQTEIGGPVPNTFLNGSITVGRGEGLTFWNLDLLAPHNVTSVQTKRVRVRKHKFKRVRLFASRTIGGGAQAPVSGVGALARGRYTFFCTIHPFMTGSLTIR